jgi:hypothetical protein
MLHPNCLILIKEYSHSYIAFRQTRIHFEHVLILHAHIRIAVRQGTHLAVRMYSKRH